MSKHDLHIQTGNDTLTAAEPPRTDLADAATGITGQILVRGDSAYGTRAVIGAARRAGAQFSLVLAKTQPCRRRLTRSPSMAGPQCATGRGPRPDTGSGSLMPRSPKSPNRDTITS
jgi:hypothetical protein